MITVIVCVCLLATANSFHTSKEDTVAGPTVIYPIKLTYIDRFNSWWPPAAIAQGLAVPGYTLNNVTLPYNYICLAFWTYGGGPVDAALVWSDPLRYFGAEAFGNTSIQIQTALKAKYTAAGVKLMVSAFGATQNPTSAGYDPVDCAKKLAQFVKVNQLDGVDIDWEDTAAFQSGDGFGQNWLITLTTNLRNLLPDAIITHAPQGPYFGGSFIYPFGGYLKVHQNVGSLIQFYNVQFYNQGSTVYNDAKGLFNSSGGWAPATSVNQMIAAGIQAQKIVIGKPASVGDASNSYITASDLNAAIATNYPFNQWKTGIMFWQYSSDKDGKICAAAAAFLDSVSSQQHNKDTQ